jgi:hypothetical protein
MWRARQGGNALKEGNDGKNGTSSCPENLEIVIEGELGCGFYATTCHR